MTTLVENVEHIHQLPEGGSLASLPNYRHWWGVPLISPTFLAHLCRDLPIPFPEAISGELSDPKGLLPVWKSLPSQRINSDQAEEAVLL